MATTTGGTTYVTSTDLVADYPTASLALANRVDVVASGGPNSIKTSGYTITLGDILGGNKFLYNSASPGTFTLPTSGLVDGMVVNVAQIGAGALTVSGGTIVGTTVTTAQYQSLQFVYASTGTTWYSVAPPAVAPGLAIVTPTSIANSGGSASASGAQITFTGVNSISLNGIFSATYDNYRVVYSVTASSANASLNHRLRAAGSDDAANNYRFASWDVNTAAGSGAVSSSSTSALGYVPIGTSSPDTRVTMDIVAPFLSQKTMALFQSYWYDGTNNGSRAGSAAHVNATSFDGLSLVPGSGTITGIIRVYGYKNS
jgi:hypothetical protein